MNQQLGKKLNYKTSHSNSEPPEQVLGFHGPFSQSI